MSPEPLPPTDGAAPTRTAFQGLRVMIVAPSSPPVAGMQVQADRLAQRLAGEGAQVLRLSTNPQIPAMLAPLTPVAAGWRRRRFTTRLIGGLARTQDVVQIHGASWNYFQDFVDPAVTEARDAGARVILRWDGADADRFLATCNDRVRATIALAHEITVASPFLANVFRSRLSIDCRVIPNLVPDPAPGGARPGADALPRCPGPIRLLCARPLVPSSGVDVVIRAVKAAAAQGVDLHLTVAGSGPDRATLETDAMRALGSRVRFVGAVPHATFASILAESDVFVNGSRADNSPVSIAEALAAGVPVATTDAGGIPSLVHHGHTGLVTAVGDADALCGSIAALARDPALREDLSWRARVEALRWTWEAVRGSWYHAFRPAVPVPSPAAA